MNSSDTTPKDRTDEPVLVCEYVDSGGRTLGFEPQRGVLRGVKLLGLRSKNGRRYEEQALRGAVGLYEGAKVNVNHPERGPLAARDYRDRLGVVRNVRLEVGDGLFGDLHYNPKHALAEQLEWDARHAPQNVGLSHNVLARTRRIDSDVVVEAITRVQSVDLVADPATTAGLFEQQADETADHAESPTLATGLIDENARLREQIERLERERSAAERRDRFEQLLAEHGLPPALGEPVVTELFVECLLSAPDEDAARLIEDRARLVGWARAQHRPRSREQTVVSRTDAATPDNAEAFVRSISKAA